MRKQPVGNSGAFFCYAFMEAIMTDDVCRIVADGPGAKWKRTAFVVDGSVFFPGAIWFGSEKKALAYAGYDGSKVVQSAGHVYLDADFLAKEYPNECDLLRSAARRVLASIEVA